MGNRTKINIVKNKVVPHFAKPRWIFYTAGEFHAKATFWILALPMAW